MGDNLMHDGDAFKDIRPEDFLAFCLFNDDDWIKRTVEKVTLISETEYQQKASFLLTVSKETLEDALASFDDFSSYWETKENAHLLSSINSLKERFQRCFAGFSQNSQEKEVIIPLFLTPKDPLVDLDIWREGAKEPIEVLNRKQAAIRSLNLLDLTFKLSLGSDFIEKNQKIICDILSCFPNHIERRLKRARYLKECMKQELIGYLNKEDLKEFTTILELGRYDNILAYAFYRSRVLCRFLKARFGYSRPPMLATPLLLIRDDYKSFRDYFPNIETWYEDFLKRIKNYIDGIFGLAKEERTFLVLMNQFNNKYILYIKTKVSLDSTLLIKYSSKKVNARFYDMRFLSWNAVKTAIQQISKKEDSKVITRIAVSKPFRFLACLYFFLTRIYFVVKIDLLGHAESYHLEFSTNDTEAIIQTCSLQYELENTSRTENIERHFGVNKIDQGHLHLYTSKQNFYTEEGISINPADYSLLIWPFIRRLPISLFFAVSLIELIGLYFLASDNPQYQPGNILGIGIISIVGTLTIRYNPGNVAACLIRRWKRIVTVGLLTTLISFAMITVLTDLSKPSLVNPIKGISFLIIGFWYIYEFALNRIFQLMRGFTFSRSARKSPFLEIKMDRPF